jgi:hypothetical protein
MKTIGNGFNPQGLRVPRVVILIAAAQEIAAALFLALVLAWL